MIGLTVVSIAYADALGQCARDEYRVGITVIRNGLIREADACHGCLVDRKRCGHRSYGVIVGSITCKSCGYGISTVLGLSVHLVAYADTIGKCTRDEYRVGITVIGNGLTREADA